MAQKSPGAQKSDAGASAVRFRHKHLLAISDLDRFEAESLMDRAGAFAPLLEQRVKKLDTLRGRTLINLFFENSTRTQSSFELAGKRMGADVVNMSVKSSSVAKGETLIDTAATLNAMRPDLLVVRHGSSGAAALLARKVDCSVINAGDGQHEHPTQALLDALTIRTALGRIEGVDIAICGDVLHSRVARSNVALLTMLGARVRLIGPPTLMPAHADRWGADVFHDMRAGLKDVDVVMMLRLQRERMQGGLFPSAREYFWFYGLDEEKLKLAKPGALVMHPGPMNRGVEIDSAIADDPRVSLIETQVRMGVAMRMAVLEALAESGANTSAAS
jgi:aspartate carbamoyltransferase catalytic subunit